MNFLQKIGRFITGMFVRSGLCVFKFLAAVLLGAVKTIGFVFSEILGIFKALGRGLAFFFRSSTEAFRSRVQLSNELMRNIRRAKKEGGKTYTKAVLTFIGSFFFGEGGVCYTAFNYILPIVCIAFLVSVISYGSGQKYGIAVEFKGEKLGIITAEADYERAERDFRQRISYSEDDDKIDLSAKLSVCVISDGDSVISAGQLADEMLEASDHELIEAYGIYIDGKFAGAVNDHNEVQSALDAALLDYKPDGIVKEVSYANKIEYTKGIYLKDSLRDEKDAIKQLTSTKEKRRVYIAGTNETVLDVIRKFGMKIDDFNRLNPNAEEGIIPGQILNVTETERFLPIQYICETETLTFLDYETIEVETSALNVGIRSVLTKGERGEKVSNYEVTYIDGIEQSRKVISSTMLKAPVVETIGIGTYSAMPDDPQTVYFGSPMTGTGYMGWPLDGGWVSDSFISDRNHKGLDIAAPEGTEIYAAAEGQVVSAGWNSGGYGNVVMIEHPDGYATVYAHMIMVYAVEGQYVTKGQLIGFVGNTGNSFGNHLHFEVRCQGICLDPAGFLNTMGMTREMKKDETLQLPE
ncbi:MAG: peptidoglycan DD-metalloendopeptidase family protein [Ruminococcus sp.]|nr:peptidoglycan DD-metalloendopeptidase family protein [Ruminococcus sp.]